MMKRSLGRREIISGLAGLAGTSALAQGALGQGSPLKTPSVERGPFYPRRQPSDSDFDMTRLGQSSIRAQGQIVELTGRVLNLRGQPVEGAVIELWQANHHGRYSHASDRNPAALDPNFQGFSSLKTRADGFYRLITIKPGAYPASPTWSRPPHIHLDVSGKDRRLVSQMFFPDETLNDLDKIYNSYSIRERASLTAKRLASGADGLTRLNWDIVLSNG